MPNGWVLPIFNENDGFVDKKNHPKQVYLTVVTGFNIKGPHLHKRRSGLLTCIVGNVKIIVRQKGKYHEFFTGENFGFRTIKIPAGIPMAIQNVDDTDAYVLNMPSPAWSKEDLDDHPVNFDDYVFTW